MSTDTTSGSAVESSQPRIPARIRLLEAMMSLDDHRSVQEHTVEELATAAGVAKGSVYYQFGSKEKLVKEMLVYGAGQLQQLMDEAATDDGASLTAARDSFAAQLQAAFEFLGRYPSFTGLVAYALARRQDDESQQLRAEKESIVELLVRGLRRVEQNQGEQSRDGASSPVRLQIAATALLSAAVTLSIEQHTTHTEWSASDCAEVLLGMV